MILVVNGQEQSVPDDARVSDLIRLLGLEKAACAVEVNRELVPKRRHDEQRLSHGDRVEVVTLVGGG